MAEDLDVLEARVVAVVAQDGDDGAAVEAQLARERPSEEAGGAGDEGGLQALLRTKSRTVCAMKSIISGERAG